MSVAISLPSALASYPSLSGTSLSIVSQPQEGQHADGAGKVDKQGLTLLAENLAGKGVSLEMGGDGPYLSLEDNTATSAKTIRANTFKSKDGKLRQSKKNLTQTPEQCAITGAVSWSRLFLGELPSLRGSLHDRGP